jgi:hypothetical protein
MQALGVNRRRWFAAAPVVLFLAVLFVVQHVAARPLHPPPSRLAPLAAPAQATVTPGHIVVRGKIYYTDRLGDRNHPAAGLRVEIWDRDERLPASGEKLGEAMTGSDGRFESREISNVDPDGPVGAREGTQDVFLKFFSNNGQVRLLKTNTTQEYAWLSYEIDPRDGLVRNVPDGTVSLANLYATESAKDIEALWTFVNLAEGWLFMKEQTGKDPGAVLAYWSQGSPDGPRYDDQANVLTFRDEDAGFASQIIQYEAYALLDNLWGGLPDAWRGCVTDPPDDLRRATDPACALLHGFAMFLSVAATENPEFETPAMSPADLDAAKAGTPGWQVGDAVPGRIAGAFWDLYEKDPTTEEYDQLNARFIDVWEVLDQRRPTTMAEWWAGWKALGKNGCGAAGSLFQNTIDYNTAPQITPIPDVILDEDETAILDLKNYVHDVDCADDTLTFTMIDPGAPEAGVTLLPTNVISITPQADWFGQTTVRLEVSDGLVKAPISFRVIVNSLNDCPTIAPRIPDPPPAAFGLPITVELADYGHDIEDRADQLAWDVELDGASAMDITVVGRGTTSLTFLLNAAIQESYSARARLTVRDRDGCPATQFIALYWTSRLNKPPTIQMDRFTREYIAPINTTIHVDLTGVATDYEDRPELLDWYVINPHDLNAQVSKLDKQVFDFEPDVGFVGSNTAELEVQDSGGARATAGITLTWQNPDTVGNLPPHILRYKLVGKTAALNAEACYELTDKAIDPDDNPLSLRWFAEPIDDTSLFVGPQGTRQLCFRSRPDFEGCLAARFIVRDPHHAEDSHEVRTCWRTVKLFLPFALQFRRGVLR